LAEQVAFRRAGLTPKPVSMLGLIADLPRVLSRELQKLLYLLPRLLLVTLLALLLPVVGQLLWLLFAGWMMTIQYIDYAFDNRRISFAQMRRELGQQRGKSLTFGLTVALLASIPGVNLLIMPLAVCAATALWVDHFHQPSYAISVTNN
jgi:CysZ protein